MKKIFVIVLVIILSSYNLSYSGFLDDIFKAVGDGIKEGLNTGANQNTGNEKRVISSQKQAYDEKRGEELYYKGIELREKGRHREAIAELEKAVQIARTYNNSFVVIFG